MSASYARVLRIPHARRTFATALIGRLSYGIVPLSVMLAVTRASGSYAVAGTVMALFGATVVFLAPTRAALIDRYGPRRALVPMLVAYTSLLALLTAAVWRPGTPAYLLGALTALAGACVPPLGPTMRSVWSRLAPDRALLQRAYSLDAVAEELLFVSGPLLVGVLVGVAVPAVGIVVGTALMVVGAVGFVASPVMRDMAPGGGRREVPLASGTAAPEGCETSGAGTADPASEAAATSGTAAATLSAGSPGATAPTSSAGVSGVVGSAGTSGVPGAVPPAASGAPEPSGASGPVGPAARRAERGRPVLRRIARPVTAAVAVGVALGVLDLLVVVFAERHGHGGASVAWVLAALSAGSAVGGLLNGTVDWRAPAPTRLALLTAALGLALLGAGLAPGLGTLALAMTVAGFFVSPAITTAYLIADEAVTDEARTRAGAWVNTAVNAGSTAGTAAAGALAGRFPVAACFAVTGAAVVLTALVVAKGAWRERGAAVAKAGETQAAEETQAGEALADV